MKRIVTEMDSLNMRMYKNIHVMDVRVRRVNYDKTTARFSYQYIFSLEEEYLRYGKKNDESVVLADTEIVLNTAQIQYLAASGKMPDVVRYFKRQGAIKERTGRVDFTDNANWAIAMDSKITFVVIPFEAGDTYKSKDEEGREIVLSHENRGCNIEILSIELDDISRGLMHMAHLPNIKGAVADILMSKRTMAFDVDAAYNALVDRVNDERNAGSTEAE